MMVMFKGEGCAECPFFNRDVVMDGGVTGESLRCSLDGRVDVAGYELNIKLGRDLKRNGDCPFLGMVGTLEVGCHE